MGRQRVLRKLMGEEVWEQYQLLRHKESSFRYLRKKGDPVSSWRRRTKKILIEYKGGKCQKCGYCKPVPGAYVFHHRDPSKKDFAISANGNCRSIEILKKEVDKCDLLCVLCHVEIHDEWFDEVRTRTSNRYDEGLLKAREERLALVKRYLPSSNVMFQCKRCGKSFGQLWLGRKYCSSQCARLASRKVERPSQEHLNKLITDGIPWLQVGRRFGVSDSAVKKWAINYGIEIPERRSDRIAERPCLKCGTTYKPTYEKQQFCSNSCARAARKVERPSKDELAEMLKTMTYDKVGEKYGVKREAIRRWASSYGLAHLRCKYGASVAQLAEQDPLKIEMQVRTLTGAEISKSGSVAQLVEHRTSEGVLEEESSMQNQSKSANAKPEGMPTPSQALSGKV